MHDFTDKNLGKAAPYGVYDTGMNKGWVSVGIGNDTAEFAVNTIRAWWYNMGEIFCKNSEKIFITADSGGSNGYRVRLWKKELQISPYAVILSVCSPTALRNVRIPGCSGSSHTEAGIIPEFCLTVRRSYGNHDL